MFDHRQSRRFDECRRCIMYCALIFMNSNFELGLLTINSQGRLFIGHYFKFTELSLFTNYDSNGLYHTIQGPEILVQICCELTLYDIS